jgi:hypothetical protein
MKRRRILYIDPLPLYILVAIALNAYLLFKVFL